MRAVFFYVSNFYAFHISFLRTLLEVECECKHVRMAKKNQESPYPPQVNYDQFAFEIGRKGQRIKPVDIFSNAPTQLRTLFAEGENPMPEAGAIYGHFKNRNKNVNGCIIHNFRFFDSNPLFLKEAPRGLAITESTGAFLVTGARHVARLGSACIF